MSRSPLTDAAEEGADRDRYLEGWARLNASMRRGEPWSGGERNAAFLSSGGASLDLVDAAPVLGLDHPDDGRSAVRMDVDFDGDDDLIVSSRTAPRLRILANRLADGAEHLGVRLVGTSSNRDAVGAVVLATAVGAEDGEPSGATQRRTRTAGSGYLAQSSAWLRFGFGPGGRRARRVRLQVRWPGSVDLEDFGEVRCGRRYVLVQGSGAASESAPPDALVLTSSPLDAPAGAGAGEDGRRRSYRCGPGPLSADLEAEARAAQVEASSVLVLPRGEAPTELLVAALDGPAAPIEELLSLARGGLTPGQGLAFFDASLLGQAAASAWLGVAAEEQRAPERWTELVLPAGSRQAVPASSTRDGELSGLLRESWLVGSSGELVRAAGEPTASR